MPSVCSNKGGPGTIFPMPCSSYILAFPIGKRIQPRIQFSLSGIFQNHSQGLFLKALQDAFSIRLNRHGEQKNISASVSTKITDTFTGYVMNKPKDMEVLRSGILEHYNISGLPKTMRTGCPTGTGDAAEGKSLPIIGFLNREGGRRVDNYQEIIDAVRDRFDKPAAEGVSFQNLTVDYKASFDGASFLDQISYMAGVDFLIGPHGAQLTSIPFLPACGGLLEFFPKGYLAHKFFGTLAAASNHSHFYMYTGKDKTKEVKHFMRSMSSRSKARRRHIEADPSLVVEVVELFIQKWQKCCEQTSLS
uniref:Glycosyltransferase 61 catalytic domain-containing protein n=2 Tax=Entomoneis paludosa TaxID=265537 RepID=A0A7S2YBX5_9STRA|mmetsp:Transcript_26489/g.55409  ORF Transcript_26489/g.55409 Transcript_26489/m.55409 type:complete len:305 (+) Transcript_26489:193-1107(+)